MINPKRICPHCGERVPYAASRCSHCRRECRTPERSRGVRRALLRSATLLVVLIALVGAGLFARNRSLVAAKYAAFAARYLPAGMSAVAPVDTGEGAFYYCLRCVARKIDSSGSVEFFPARDDGDIAELGEGRYEVQSFVDEAREDGATVRRGFSCIARYDSGRWMLEELALERGRPAGADLAGG